MRGAVICSGLCHGFQVGLFCFFHSGYALEAFNSFFTNYNKTAMFKHNTEHKNAT
jgi:hypothetical protein